ncbi:hypothetical protein CGRA01v4_09071 [Colletotrichum graminicola]|nr:hypothetical protein CGRA01v4_09071 [Colletotrichum graminicola]
MMRWSFTMLLRSAWQALEQTVHELTQVPADDQNTGPVPCGVTWLVGIMDGLGRWTKSVVITLVRSDIRVSRGVRCSAPQKELSAGSPRASHIESAAGLPLLNMPCVEEGAVPIIRHLDRKLKTRNSKPQSD